MFWYILDGTNYKDNSKEELNSCGTGDQVAMYKSCLGQFGGNYKMLSSVG